MSTFSFTVAGVAIPFIGTTLGAAMVFFLKKEIKSGVQRLLLGFASGVMIAASVWSLIMPAIDMAQEQGLIPWVPAAVGFLLGIGFLLLLDIITPHLHMGDKPEGPKTKLGKSAMLIFAVTLHNIPEGMAVGVVLAGALSGNGSITMASALALSVGIALQNFPEGAIISMPIAGEVGKKKSFIYGALTGVVEPIAALITIALTSAIVPVLPYILSFAAGAMMYVVVEELIPEAQSGEDHSNIGTIGAAIGFVLMMILDVALG